MLRWLNGKITFNCLKKNFYLKMNNKKVLFVYNSVKLLLAGSSSFSLIVDSVARPELECWAWSRRPLTSPWLKKQKTKTFYQGKTYLDIRLLNFFVNKFRKIINYFTNQQKKKHFIKVNNYVSFVSKFWHVFLVNKNDRAHLFSIVRGNRRIINCSRTFLFYLLTSLYVDKTS